MQIEDVEGVSRVLWQTMLESWERLEKDYYPRRALEFDINHNSPEMLKQRFADSQNFGFVAEENNILIATALGKTIGESGLASLGWIGVHPDYQRKGIGKALLQRVIEYCKARGHHKIILYTLPALVPAINLYLKCGFVPEAYLRKEWWKVDFIKMSLWLETEKRNTVSSLR